MVKRKDGLWQERFQPRDANGKKIGKVKYFYGKTKSEVLRKVQQFETAVEQGVSFDDVAEMWWDEHEKTLAYNTAKSYKPAKERAVEYFKEVPIKSITPVQIGAHIRDFAKTHYDKTVRTQLMIYNLIFKYAVEEGYIPFGSTT